MKREQKRAGLISLEQSTNKPFIFYFQRTSSTFAAAQPIRAMKCVTHQWQQSLLFKCLRFEQEEGPDKHFRENKHKLADWSGSRAKRGHTFENKQSQKQPLPPKMWPPLRGVVFMQRGGAMKAPCE